jgi:hypothetical protein
MFETGIETTKGGHFSKNDWGEVWAQETAAAIASIDDSEWDAIVAAVLEVVHSKPATQDSQPKSRKQVMKSARAHLLPRDGALVLIL